MADNVKCGPEPPKASEHVKMPSIGRNVEADCKLNATLKQETKAPSFQITSVYVSRNSQTSNDGGNDSADDLDESDTSDFSVENSRPDKGLDCETPLNFKVSSSKNDAYSDLSNKSVDSVSIIPTSSHYGLAIVGSDKENCANSASLTNAANNVRSSEANISVAKTGSVADLNTDTKSDVEVRDCPPQQSNRNERFRVVKIESTEPFKCGRWVCMDYLDHSVLPRQRFQLPTMTDAKQADSDPSVGTAKFSAPDSGLGIAFDGQSYGTTEELANPTNLASVVQDGLQGCVNPPTAQTVTSTPYDTSHLGQQEPKPPLLGGTDVPQNQSSLQPQQMAISNNQISSQSQPTNTQNLQHLYSPLINPQFQPFNTISQPNSPRHVQNQRVQQPQQAQLPQQFYPQGQQANSLPQQSNTQQFAQSQQSAAHVQQIPQRQTSQSGSMQQQLQGQSLQHGAQPFGNMSQAQTFQHQTPPPLQLPQLLNSVLQQIAAQQDAAQKQHLIHHLSNHLLSQTPQQQRQYYVPDAASLAPAENPMSSMSQSTPASLQQCNTSVPTMVAESVPVSSQNLPHIVRMMQQTSTPNQQIIDQLAFQQAGTRQAQSQTQFPIQHQQFAVHQQFPMQQQTPVVQLFPVQQQHQMTIQSQPNLIQQQIMQPNCQYIPNMLPLGQQIPAHNIPVGDSSPNLALHNVNQPISFQGRPNYKDGSNMQQNYGNQYLNMSQSEIYLTPTNSQTEQEQHCAEVDRSSGTQPGASEMLPSKLEGCTISSCSHVESVERPLLDSFMDIVASREDPEGSSGTNAVAIDNKIEQAMDLVKSHLMFAVREEVEVLREKIAELMDRINHLEAENNLLRPYAPPGMSTERSPASQSAADTTLDTRSPVTQNPPDDLAK